MFIKYQLFSTDYLNDYLMSLYEKNDRRRDEIIRCLDSLYKKRERQPKDVALFDQSIERKRIELSDCVLNIRERNGKTIREIEDRFESIKLSKTFSASFQKRILGVSREDLRKDFSCVHFKNLPYGIEMDSERVYFSPGAIWIFDDEFGFRGVYKPSAIRVSIQDEPLKKNTLYNPLQPRYKYKIKNDEKFDLNIYICDRLFDYKVDSYEKTRQLKEAIDQYSVETGYIDAVPLVVELMSLCANNTETMKVIREKTLDRITEKPTA